MGWEYNNEFNYFQKKTDSGIDIMDMDEATEWINMLEESNTKVLEAVTSMQEDLKQARDLLFK